MTDVRFRVNAPQVIHEAIEGEVIIINLETGNYYSLKGSGASIWEVLHNSTAIDLEGVVDALAPRFDTPRAELEAALGRFVDELSAEGLLVGADAADEPDTPRAAISADGAAKQAFEQPVLEKYTDMQDLVLLDPVHEVDEAGWPQQRPDVSVSGSGG